MGERLDWDEIRKRFPDTWVVLENCEWENKSNIRSAVIVDTCGDDEISHRRIQNRENKSGYTFRRTSEGMFVPYVQAVNFEVRS